MQMIEGQAKVPQGIIGLHESILGAGGDPVFIGAAGVRRVTETFGAKVAISRALSKVANLDFSGVPPALRTAVINIIGEMNDTKEDAPDLPPDVIEEKQALKEEERKPVDPFKR